MLVQTSAKSSWKSIQNCLGSPAGTITENSKHFDHIVKQLILIKRYHNLLMKYYVLLFLLLLNVHVVVVVVVFNNRNI